MKRITRHLQPKSYQHTRLLYLFSTMTIQEVVRVIDESGYTGNPFVITFSKASGELRQMACVKRNKQRTARGTAKEGSGFKYYLRKKNALLVNELVKFRTKKEDIPGVGTLHRLIDTPNLNTRVHRSFSEGGAPKTIKLFSIIEFNGQQVQP